MRGSVIFCVVLGLSVSGCARIADSRINPLNWVGARAAAPAEGAEIRPLVPPGAMQQTIDTRPEIAQVTAVEFAATAHGALISARGLATGLGHSNVELVLVGIDGTTLVLSFRAAPPSAAQAGAQRIIAAYDLSQDAAAGLTAVRVEAAQNALTAGR